nr:MAG TPA: HOLLIDAY JUNCTION RESOLVASE HOMOLOGOUS RECOMBINATION [Caudoviricetes sp.]
MARNRNSAKQAGARFERQISDFLRDNLDDRIDRKVRTGAKDCGDVANVRDSHNRRIVIEAKDYGGRLNLPQWIKEAHTEADNDDAHVGLVIAKRRGTTNPADQWVAMTVNDLIQLLTPPQGNTQ